MFVFPYLLGLAESPGHPLFEGGASGWTSLVRSRPHTGVRAAFYLLFPPPCPLPSFSYYCTSVWGLSSEKRDGCPSMCWSNQLLMEFEFPLCIYGTLCIMVHCHMLGPIYILNAPGAAIAGDSDTPVRSTLGPDDDLSYACTE